MKLCDFGGYDLLSYVILLSMTVTFFSSFITYSVYVIHCYFIFLQKGDIIKVLKKNDNGNWFGQNGERTGYFQFTYVQAMMPDNEQPC